MLIVIMTRNVTRNAREREADMPVRLGKDIVHAQHAEHRVEQAEEKAVCEKRRQKDIEQENHGDVARGLARVEVTHECRQTNTDAA